MKNNINQPRTLTLHGCGTAHARLYPLEHQETLKIKYLEKGYSIFWHKDQTLGLMDSFGHVVIPPQWDSIHIQTDPGVVFCEKNNRTILFGLDGNPLLSADMQSQLNMGPGIVVMDKEGKMHSIEMGAYSDGLARGRIGGIFCYVNLKGRVVILMNRGIASGDFHNGFAVYRAKKKLFTKPSFGYFSKQGKTVIPAAYAYADDFTGNVAWVRNDAGLHLIRPDGTVLELQYPQRYEQIPRHLFHVISNFRAGHAIFSMLPKSRSYVLDGLPVSVEESDYGYGLVSESGEFTTSRLYDRLCETHVDGVYVCSTAHNPSKSLYGLIDAGGNVLLPEEYSDIKEKHCELFQVEQDGKLGLVTKEGKFLLQPEWDAIQVIDRETINFKRDNVWGYMDLEQRYYAEPKLASPVIIRNGAVMTDRDGILCLLNLTGEPALAENPEILDCVRPGLLLVRYEEKLHLLDLEQES